MIYRLIILLLLGCVAAPAETPRITGIVIYDNVALVRAEEVLDLQRGEQWLSLETGSPPVDDKMVLRGLLYPVELLDWGRGAKREPRERLHDAMVYDMQRAAFEEVATDYHSMDVKLRAYHSGPQDVEWAYWTGPLQWKSRYRIVIRDEKGQGDASVDLQCLVSIKNQTPQVFEDVAATVVGHDGPVTGNREHPTGFLDFRDSPLGMRFVEKEQKELAERAYKLPGRISLQPYTETVLSMVSVKRVRGKRQFQMHSANFPLQIKRSKLPLYEFLEVQNISKNGLGMSLPPGEVTVTERDDKKKAWISHVSASKYLRVSLGPSESVGGYRRRISRTQLSPQLYEDEYELVIQNSRPQEADVRILESPPVDFKWDLVRCTEEAELVDRSLLMNVVIAAGRTRRIEYKVKVYAP